MLTLRCCSLAAAAAQVSEAPLVTIDMKIGGGITTSQMNQSTVISCHGSLTFQSSDNGTLDKRQKNGISKTTLQIEGAVARRFFLPVTRKSRTIVAARIGAAAASCETTPR